MISMYNQIKRDREREVIRLDGDGLHRKIGMQDIKMDRIVEMARGYQPA